MFCVDCEENRRVSFNFNQDSVGIFKSLNHFSVISSLSLEYAETRSLMPVNNSHL